MTKKRFECEDKSLYIDDDYFCELEDGDEITELLNRQQYTVETVRKENEQLKEHIKSLEKQCHLIHMQSMFSTVKSFNGDVSKRYKYSEKTDTIYDTANKYGKYDKILNKKEIIMLLNEYETILKELKE